MQKAYSSGNRKRRYPRKGAGSLIAIFSGEALWNADSVHLTGLKCKSAVMRGEA